MILSSLHLESTASGTISQTPLLPPLERWQAAEILKQPPYVWPGVSTPMAPQSHANVDGQLKVNSEWLACVVREQRAGAARAEHV